MRRIRPLEWGLVVFAAVVVGAALWPVYPRDPMSRSWMCLSNVKQISLGLIMYAGDENDRFPLRDEWADEIVPYTKSPDLFHDPAFSKDGVKGPYAYAFNGALSGEKEQRIADPVATPMVYDSVNPIRNASDLCASLPLPGRHGQKEAGGRNNVGYVDGHAKQVPARAR